MTPQGLADLYDSAWIEAREQCADIESADKTAALAVYRRGLTDAAGICHKYASECQNEFEPSTQDGALGCESAIRRAAGGEQ